MAVQAPIVEDPRKWDFAYNDREEMIVKQKALNQWRYDFSQQLTAMVEALNGEFQYVAETRIDITKKAGQVAADRQHVDAQKKAVDTAKSHVDAQKKAIDTTAGEVDANARQVAADKGEVAKDKQAAAQSASAASGSAKAAQTARNQAEGLYGDLSAVNAAKTATQQAAQTAGQQAQAAGHSAEQANTARSGAEAALAKALEAAADANVDIDAAIAALVDSSPDALNTLNELAAALGDDPNFASTVNSELAKKLDKGHATAANPHPQYLLMDGALTWNGQKFGTVLVHDARDLNPDGRDSSYLPTPDEMPDRALTALFSTGLPGNSWRSALVMSGWNDGYTSWMLTGPSGTGVEEDYYLTSGRSGEWGADRKIWHDGNFNPTDYARPDSAQRWAGGTQTFRSPIAYEGPNGAYARSDARDTGNSTRVHSYNVIPGGGGANAYLQAWYGGSTYTNVTTTNDGVEFDKSLTTPELRLPSGVSITGVTNGLEISRAAGSVEIGNRNSGYTHYSSSAGNHYFYGKLHSQSGFYGDGSGLTNLDAGNIDRGTINFARVPSTSSRFSTSTSHALNADAMNAHRTSGDHDSRYYTKSQVDALAKPQEDFRNVGAYVTARSRTGSYSNSYIKAGDMCKGSDLVGYTIDGRDWFHSFTGTWVAMTDADFYETGLFLRIAE
ncbi:MULTISPECIES: hypothetical protein [unclassified Halomonas]|uniref:hypothetical protein n=1 Tax=unclassified Halomonas TaxID=2609666 RepID=UPI00207668DF|nr:MULTISPECIES: hypothetical protein [unclassified Halomonas]